MDFFTSIFDLIIDFLQSLLGLVEGFFTLIINFLQSLLNIFS